MANEDYYKLCIDNRILQYNVGLYTLKMQKTHYFNPFVFMLSILLLYQFCKEKIRNEEQWSNLFMG